jgi:invasion protein IalB
MATTWHGTTIPQPKLAPIQLGTLLNQGCSAEFLLNTIDTHTLNSGAVYIITLYYIDIKNFSVRGSY